MENTESSTKDPLLEALLVINRLNGKNFAPETILSGLPLEDNKLTLDLFDRAAARCGLSAETIEQPLDAIHSKMLPALLLLNDNKTCVVTDINDNVLEVIHPGNSGETTNIHLSTLKKQYSGYAIFIEEFYNLDQRTAEFEVEEPKHWFWKVIRDAWKSYGEVLVASFLINIFALAIPLFVLNVYDRVVPNNAVETLWVLSLGMLIVIGFEFTMRTLRAYYIDTVGRKIDLKLSSETFAQVLGLKMADRPNSVGSLANTIQSFESFREFITSATISLVVDLPFSLFFIMIIALINPAVAIVPIVAIPIILTVSLILQKPIETLVNKSYRHSAEKQAILVETISSPETIKCLNAEGLNQKKWEKVIDASSKLGLKIRRYVNFGVNFAISMQFLSIVSVVIVGVYAIQVGELTIGGLIACTILNGRAIAPIVQVANLLIRYKQSKVALNSLDTIMQKSTDRPEDATYINVSKINGSVEFNDISFTYPDQPIEALSKVSFKIKSGDKIGIVGPAGSGKSTLAKLILKLYQPNSGHVLIDNIDTKHIDSAVLHKYIGYIPQFATLFHGTIRDNITIAAPNISDDTLLRVAKISGVHQFANMHPDGYDRQVGERGNLLSGGQKQSIIIARALLLDPEIYLFDEPTSSLDNARIKHFLSQLKEEIENKTFIVITHKKNVLSLVDYIVVMDAGKILAQGPKEKIIELLKQKNT